MTTNNTTTTNVKPAFNAAKYAQYLRSATAQREQLLVDVYNDTSDLAEFASGCEQVALKYATTSGVSTQTVGMLSMISKVPEKALLKMLDSSKEKFEKSNKDSTALIFAKLLIQYTAAMATVLKFANIVDK